MRNGKYPLIFIGRVYKSMRNGTSPLMFIRQVYNKNPVCSTVHRGDDRWIATIPKGSNSN